MKKDLLICSSSVVADPPEGLMCCAFGDAFLLTTRSVYELLQTDASVSQLNPVWLSSDLFLSSALACNSKCFSVFTPFCVNSGETVVCEKPKLAVSEIFTYTSLFGTNNHALG